MIHNQHIVTITGGSFQGKSLISLAVACQFQFSGVISSDMVRNLAKTMYPEKKFLSTSTYLLSHEDLEKQRSLVSEMIADILPIYDLRGERIIIEGMHFSRKILTHFSERGFCNIFLNNNSSFEKRILLKQLTRRNLHYSGNLKGDSVKLMEKDAVKKTMYYEYQGRIMEIHEQIKNDCLDLGFHIVEFENIDHGKKQVEKIVKKWLNGNNTERIG